MLAILEWHMATEGLDTESICPRCQAMRTVAKGALPFVSFLVDYDTLESCARGQPPEKGMGTDRVPRELYKYGLRCFLELLRASIDAYLKGEHPTVCRHEWMGS